MENASMRKSGDILFCVQHSCNSRISLNYKSLFWNMIKDIFIWIVLQCLNQVLTVPPEKTIMHPLLMAKLDNYY
jgi:hypothetical protein